MIYFTGVNDKHVLVLSLHDLKVIGEGQAIASPDSQVLLCFTPDIAWFRDQLLKVFNENNHTLQTSKFDELLREGLKRPAGSED